MPIEIRELVIKATIRDTDGEQTESQTREAAGKEEIIAECVDQVMEIIKLKLER